MTRGLIMKTELWLLGNESRIPESILNFQETFIIDDQLAKCQFATTFSLDHN